MNIYLAVTIDVEPDCSPTWHYSDPLSFTAVSKGIAGLLHPLFLQFGIEPTYLINNVVLEDEQSISIFKELKGAFELGTHLHGDFIEPGKIHSDYAGKDGVMNQCFLDPEVEFGKLKNITELFTERFGYKPVSFRAGRFSAGKNTMRCLEKLGYKVDTSVTPGIIWNDASREKPVDFSEAPNQPYWTNDFTFPYSSQQKSILQVPVTILSKRKWGILKRVSWLRPFYSDSSQMIRISKRLMNGNQNRPIVLNMMFHNVEVMQGLNPYTRSNTDVSEYLDSMKRFFTFCKNNNVQPATLSYVYKIFSEPQCLRND